MSLEMLPAGPLDQLVARLRRVEAAIAADFGPDKQAGRAGPSRAHLLALIDDLTAAHAALESEAGKLRAEIARLDRSLNATSAYGAVRNAGHARQGTRQ